MRDQPLRPATGDDPARGGAPLPPAPAGRTPDDRLTGRVRAPVADPAAVRDGDDPLLRLAAELLAAVTAQDVLDLVADRAEQLVGATLVTASVLEPDGDWLRLVVARNAPTDAAADYRRFRLDASTITGDAVLRREVVLLASRAERERRYPRLAATAVPQEATATLPLVVGDRVLGAMSLGFDAPQLFTPEHVALMADLARMCALALSRAAAHDAERVARRAAEDAARRFDALDRTIHRLATATRVQDVVDAVLAAAADTLGASAAVLAEHDPAAGVVRTLAAVGLPAALQDAATEFPLVADPVAAELVRTRAPILVTSREDRDARFPGLAGSGVRQQAWANLPFLDDDRVVGWLALGWDDARDFADDDVRYLRLLVAHTTAAAERVRLLEATRSTAEVLQRALLPEVTAVPGWELATLYLPAGSGSEVGGDWFDAFALPDGRVGLVIGDVAGKGPRAATVMGSVRSALRAYAAVRPDPGDVLARLDGYIALFKPDELLTCLFAVLDPVSGCLHYANAGHPPGLVVGDGGAARWLDERVDAPLGVGVDLGRRTVRTTVGEPGGVLLLYSDGLVERRRGPVQVGLDELAAAAADLTGDALAPGLDRLVTAMHTADSTVDDRALLALRRQPGV